MKKLIPLMLILIMSFVMSLNVFAAEEDYIEDNNDYSHELIGLEGTESKERWDYTNTTNQACSVSNGRAIINAGVWGYNGKTTKIVMHMYLQQSKDGSAWTNLASFTDTSNTYYITKEHYYSTCPKGYTYRLRCSYYVYAGDKYEHIIAYSSNFKY